MFRIGAAANQPPPPALEHLVTLEEETVTTTEIVQETSFVDLTTVVHSIPMPLMMLIRVLIAVQPHELC